MRNDYYVKMGWADGYFGCLMGPKELESLTQEEAWDYVEGLREGEYDSIVDEDGAPPESYYEKRHNI